MPRPTNTRPTAAADFAALRRRVDGSAIESGDQVIEELRVLQYGRDTFTPPPLGGARTLAAPRDTRPEDGRVRPWQAD